MPVYFVQAGEDGPIKIGYARDPAARFSNLQTGHPETLHLRAVMDGSADMERALHRRFAQSRRRAEWFNVSAELVALMNEHAYQPTRKLRSPRPANKYRPSVAVSVVDALGGLVRSASLLGIPMTTIDGWRRRGNIPGWRRSAIIAAAEREGVALPGGFLSPASKPQEAA